MALFLKIALFPLLLLTAGIGTVATWLVWVLFNPSTRKPHPKPSTGMVPVWVIDEIEQDSETRVRELERQHDAELKRRERIYQDQLKRLRRPR